MTRLIAALVILVACGVAPAGHAQDDCDEEAIAAGECGGEAAQANGASADAEGLGEEDATDAESQPESDSDEPVADDGAGEDTAGADVDSEDSGEEDMADSEPQADDENVEPMADDESGNEDAAADDGADMSDAAESDAAADEDTATAGAEEEESDDDLDTEIAAATDDDDEDGADAASGDDLLSTPPLGDPDAPRTPSSGPSTPATQKPAPLVTQTPAPSLTPPPTPSAGTPAQANCAGGGYGGGYRKVPGGSCRTPPAPAPAQTGPMTIYVGNLSWNLSEDELANLFAPYGEVSQAKIVTDKSKNNRSKGFGFVTMPDLESAKSAIAGLNETEVDGRKLIVNGVNESQPPSGR